MKIYVVIGMSVDDMTVEAAYLDKGNAEARADQLNPGGKGRWHYSVSETEIADMSTGALS